jgi:MFS family permease
MFAASHVGAFAEMRNGKAGQNKPFIGKRYRNSDVILLATFTHFLVLQVTGLYMSNKRWVIFVICVSLFLMSMFYRVSSAIIAPDLSRDLALNPEQLGLLGGVFFYAFALVQLPLGLLLDRFGAKMTMVFLNVLGTAGTLIFANANDLTVGVFGRALMGLGMAANLMGPFKFLTIWFDLRKFATLSGLLISIGTLGSIAATSPLALLVQYLGWRGSFYVLAGLHFLLTLCLLIFAGDTAAEEQADHDAPVDRFSNHSVLNDMKTLISSWNYWAISLSIFARYGTYVSIQGLWAGPFLIQYMKLAPVAAGKLLIMLSIGYIVGCPIGGMLSDRIFKSRKWTLIFGLAISATATFVLAQWQSTSYLALLGAVLFVMGFFNGFNQLSYAHIRELMPWEMSGIAMTGVNFFTMMGAGVFIHGLGSVMKHMAAPLSDGGEAYRTAFLICFGALVVALALYITTRDSFASAKALSAQRR